MQIPANKEASVVQVRSRDAAHVFALLVFYAYVLTRAPLRSLILPCESFPSSEGKKHLRLCPLQAAQTPVRSRCVSIVWLQRVGCGSQHVRPSRHCGPFRYYVALGSPLSYAGIVTVPAVPSSAAITRATAGVRGRAYYYYLKSS